VFTAYGIKHRRCCLQAASSVHQVGCLYHLVNILKLKDELNTDTFFLEVSVFKYWATFMQNN